MSQIMNCTENEIWDSMEKAFLWLGINKILIMRTLITAVASKKLQRSKAQLTAAGMGTFLVLN